MAGWRVGELLHTDVIPTAFNQAVAICQPPPGLLVHADRGSQYPRGVLTSPLGHTQAIANLRRPGNP